MDDPYKVLGVSPSASDDEIKSAYRNLAKKYHPDNYADSPLADLATEKMKEINEAYSAINKMRSGGGSSSGYGSAGYGASGGYDGYRTSYSGGSTRFAHVRSMINAGQISQAQGVLDAVPLAERDAEWHFLMGSVMYRRGWTSEAYVNFQNACRQDPQNPEYREALGRMESQMNGNMWGGFGGYNQVNNQQGCTGCDICTGLICADCLCGGLGGGGC